MDPTVVFWIEFIGAIAGILGLVIAIVQVVEANPKLLQQLGGLWRSAISATPRFLLVIVGIVIASVALGLIIHFSSDIVTGIRNALPVLAVIGGMLLVGATGVVVGRYLVRHPPVLKVVARSLGIALAATLVTVGGVSLARSLSNGRPSLSAAQLPTPTASPAPSPTATISPTSILVGPTPTLVVLTSNLRLDGPATALPYTCKSQNPPASLPYSSTLTIQTTTTNSQPLNGYYFEPQYWLVTTDNPNWQISPDTGVAQPDGSTETLTLTIKEWLSSGQSATLTFHYCTSSSCSKFLDSYYNELQLNYAC